VGFEILDGKSSDMRRCECREFDPSFPLDTSFHGRLRRLSRKDHSGVLAFGVQASTIASKATIASVPSAKKGSWCMLGSAIVDFSALSMVVRSTEALQRLG
jgi:hypothetical protein